MNHEKNEPNSKDRKDHNVVRDVFHVGNFNDLEHRPGQKNQKSRVERKENEDGEL